MSVCRSCEREIVWAETSTTRSRIPLDPQPVPEGNVVLVPSSVEDAPATAFVLGGEALARARLDQRRLYRSHFASCPHAARWRRPRTKEEK